MSEPTPPDQTAPLAETQAGTVPAGPAPAGQVPYASSGPYAVYAPVATVAPSRRTDWRTWVPVAVPAAAFFGIIALFMPAMTASGWGYSVSYSLFDAEMDVFAGLGALLMLVLLIVLGMGLVGVFVRRRWSRIAAAVVSFVGAGIIFLGVASFARLLSDAASNPWSGGTASLGSGQVLLVVLALVLVAAGVIMLLPNRGSAPAPQTAPLGYVAVPGGYAPVVPAGAEAYVWQGVPVAAAAAGPVPAQAPVAPAVATPTDPMPSTATAVPAAVPHDALSAPLVPHAAAVQQSAHGVPLQHPTAPQSEPAQPAPQAPTAPTPSPAPTAQSDIPPLPETLDPAQLQELAADYPAYRPAVARHPAAYPALLEWLAELHDPEVDAALAEVALRSRT